MTVSEMVGETLFATLARAVRGSVERALAAGGGKLFSVETAGLYELYLNEFPEALRQQHRCACCRGFFRRYGGLVTLTDRGVARSALWDVQDAELSGTMAVVVLGPIVAALRREVEARRVVRQQAWRESILGTPELGGFEHLAFRVPAMKLPEHRTERQHMAALVEDHRTLSRAATEMAPEHVKTAVALLEAGSLDRAEALLPMGRFLQGLQERLAAAKSMGRKRDPIDLERHHSARRDAIVWQAVGQASPGWCSPRGSAFGALVEDVAAGRHTPSLARAHAARVTPERYQRPQALPTAGNRQLAERRVAELGLAPALRRRPMALEEAITFWTPAREAPAAGGVFAAVRTKHDPPVGPTELTAGRVTMTLAKFTRDVLPKARSMRLQLKAWGNYGALTTAVDPEAPPLLKWDRYDLRNPGALYLYVSGSASFDWGLGHGGWATVLGLTRHPSAWYGGHAASELVMFVLEGAADQKKSGLGLFPQDLRTELFEVRATLEAFSQAGALDPEPRQRASGYLFGGSELLDLEVTTALGVGRYVLDRME